jgi:hypothetical protein
MSRCCNPCRNASTCYRNTYKRAVIDIIPWGPEVLTNLLPNIDFYRREIIIKL